MEQSPGVSHPVPPQPTTAGHAGRLPRAASFWVVVAALLAVTAAAAAPSPLYQVFQHRWGFSTISLTVVFAVYAVALLVALLVVGALSDHVGRRPVLAAALVVDAVAMAAFLVAGGVTGLIVARVVQGLATGAALGVLSAALVDLAPPDRPALGSLLNSVGSTLGLAVGALGAGVIVQLTADPVGPVFGGLAVACLLLALIVPALPETAPRRPGALRSLRPRAAVPSQARSAFLAGLPVLVATWALGGLYLSLGPSLARTTLHVSTPLIGAAVITVLMASGALASAAVGSGDPATVMARGSLVLAVGGVATLVALQADSAAGFFAGTAVAGAGFGSSFSGTLRSLGQLALPAQRAELFSAIFVACYLAFSLPAVLAGVLSGPLGLRTTASWYGAVVVVLAVIAAVRGRTALVSR